MGDPNTYPTKRRYPRARGPFDGYYIESRTAVLIYDLNVGGGFVNFGHPQPSAADFVLLVALPREGMVTVTAETVYRHESGIAVRFVDVDGDTSARLARAVNAVIKLPPAN
jgi:hypothetical protein